MPTEISREDIQHVLSLLKRAIRSSGLSQKEVDRAIGVKPGYLSQVMIGRLDLKLKHLLAALEAIQVEPEGFFDLAFPQPSADPAASPGVLQLLPVQAAEAEPAREAQADQAIPDEELQRLVLRALAEELGIAVQAPPEDEPGSPKT